MSMLLDLSGLKCPLPALRTRKALKRAPSGQVLTVIATDPMAAIDIPHLCASEGHRLIERTQEDGEAGAIRLRFVIERAG
jgi:tRNA 2-thiouridine synthesizing protein A